MALAGWKYVQKMVFLKWPVKQCECIYKKMEVELWREEVLRSLWLVSWRCWQPWDPARKRVHSFGGQQDFVEYDMTTGAETYFTVTVPGEDTGDLTMQGLAGEPEDADGDLTMPGYQGRPDPTPATAKKKNCWVKKGSYY